MAQAQIPTDFIVSGERLAAPADAFVRVPRRGVVRRWLSFIASAWREGIEMYASGGIRRGPPGWFG